MMKGVAVELVSKSPLANEQHKLLLLVVSAKGNLLSNAPALCRSE
jgi:hypothetical protein